VKRLAEPRAGLTGREAAFPNARPAAGSGEFQIRSGNRSGLPVGPLPLISKWFLCAFARSGLPRPGALPRSSVGCADPKTPAQLLRFRVRAALAVRRVRVFGSCTGKSCVILRHPLSFSRCNGSGLLVPRGGRPPDDRHGSESRAGREQRSAFWRVFRRRSPVHLWAARPDGGTLFVVWIAVSWFLTSGFSGIFFTTPKQPKRPNGTHLKPLPYSVWTVWAPFGVGSLAQTVPFGVFGLFGVFGAFALFGVFGPFGGLVCVKGLRYIAPSRYSLTARLSSWQREDSGLSRNSFSGDRLFPLDTKDLHPL